MFENKGIAAISLPSDKTGSIVRFVSAKKWKKSMLSNLIQMEKEFPNKVNLLCDLKTIVENISNQKITEATLSIHPFKPEFIESSPILIGNHQSTMAQTLSKIVKQRVSKSKIIEKGYISFVTEKTLTKEFNKSYHPYRFILKNFCHLLELKAQSKSKNTKNIDELKQQLRKDLKVLQVFIQRVSEPYHVIFETSTFEQRQLYLKKFEKFISQFLIQNEILNNSFQKILRFHCRKQNQEKKGLLQDFADPKDFQLTQNFQIDGCYLRSMNSLMEFADEHEPAKLLQKLKEFRQNIIVDINSYYIDIKKEPRQLQLDAEHQIGIIKFIVTKLKNWSIQIYSSLKLLQVVLGQEQIGYKFDDASYIYTQLSVVFQILQFY